jgi:hypothetical protein
MKTGRGVWVAAVISLTLFGCASARQARDVASSGSGFLGDYSMLKPTIDGGALLAYKNPAVNFEQYDKILLDPVAIWISADSDLNDLSDEDRKKVADQMFQLLHARLARDYAMVTSAEPGTLRIAAALTGGESSKPVLDTLSTITPLGMVTSTLRTMATGKPAFVGEATAEIKVTDASSGVVAFEGVDRRLGTKNLAGVWNRWEDVDNALEYWAARTGYRLCIERGASGCVAP